MSTEVIQQLTEAQAEAREAGAEETRLAAEVKQLHNTLYAPLCERKKAATKRAEAARKVLKDLLAQNEELVVAVKGLK